MLTLPTPTDAHEEITSEIDGVVLTLTWHYSARDESWRIDVADSAGVVLRRGCRLSPGWNPLLRFRSTDMPAGKFWFRSPTDPPGRDCFDDQTAALLYFTAAEVAALDAVAAAAAPITIAVNVDDEGA